MGKRACASSFLFIGCAAFGGGKDTVRVGHQPHSPAGHLEILQTAFAHSGHAVEFVVSEPQPDDLIVTSADLAADMRANLFDVGLSAHGGILNGWTAEFAYSLPSHAYTNAVFTLANGPSVKSVDDLAGMTVVSWDSVHEDLGLASTFNFVPSNNDDFLDHLMEYANANFGTALIYDVSQVMHALRATYGPLGPNKVKISHMFPGIAPFPSACVDPAVCAALDAGLRKMCQSGEYSQILKKHDVLPPDGETVCDEY